MMPPPGTLLFRRRGLRSYCSPHRPTAIERRPRCSAGLNLPEGSRFRICPAAKAGICASYARVGAAGAFCRRSPPATTGSASSHKSTRVPGLHEVPPDASCVAFWLEQSGYGRTGPQAPGRPDVAVSAIFMPAEEQKNRRGRGPTRFFCERDERGYFNSTMRRVSLNPIRFER